MAQTVSNFADVMKEVWTSDRLEKQFYDENPLLDRIEKTNRHTIGEEAHVPLHVGRSGGYTSTLAAGSTALNAAGQQEVDRATYKLIYHWFQIGLQFAALNEAAGGAQSVASAIDLEVTGALADMRKQIMRQVVSNGDGIIAKCGTTTATTEVELDTSDYGYDAIVRGWLYPGLRVQIGTSGDRDADTADGLISAVEEDPDTPSITIDDSITTTTSDFVGVAGGASAAGVTNEMNGLRQIAGTADSAVGGLDPDTAGEEFWKPATVETATSLSLNMLLTMRRKIHQKTGRQSPATVVTSLKQEAAYYELLQNQVRFSADRVSAGGGDGGFGQAEVLGVPDIPDKELYMLTLSDLLLITGKYGKPTWISDVEGSGGKLRWEQGKTSFVDALVYPLQLGCSRRNGFAANISLTA